MIAHQLAREIAIAIATRADHDDVEIYYDKGSASAGWRILD